MTKTAQYFRWFGTTSLLVFIASCSTTQEAPRVPSPAPRPVIDYKDLQNRLGLDIGPGETGFRERKFDACDLGEGLQALQPPLQDCRRAYFTLIRYQLSCRNEAEPTMVLTESDLTPLANRPLTFTLGDIQGPTPTNDRGEGVIRAISSSSRRNAFLKLSTGVDYLVIRANAATAITTPPNWCQ